MDRASYPFAFVPIRICEVDRRRESGSEVLGEHGIEAAKRPTLRTHENRRYVKLRQIEAGWHHPSLPLRSGEALVDLRGCRPMLAMSVRVLLILITALAVATVVFLIATA